MKGFIQDEDVGAFANGISVPDKVAQCNLCTDIEAWHFKDFF